MVLEVIFFFSYIQEMTLAELFFVFLDLHRPQDVSIALDFLGQEAQETQAREKNNVNKILIKIYNFFSTKPNFFLREKRLFLRKITLKIIFFSTKFCFQAHAKRSSTRVWWFLNMWFCFFEKYFEQKNSRVNTYCFGFITRRV